MDIPFEKLGHPGLLTDLHVVPQLLDDKSDDGSRLTSSAERDFEVAALLSKAPTSTEAVDLRFSEADGGSYFKFFPPALAVNTDWGTVLVGKNTAGEASFVKMTCRARSPDEALERLQLACSSFLDHWAYEATAPVYLTIFRSRDTSNNIEMARFASPFRRATINPSATEIPTALRPALALYREALSSASPLYKFLCLYKILEGYFGRLKPDLAKIFRLSSLTYPVPAELVPDHPDMEPQFRAYIGQSITKFKNEILKPDFRNAVAHFGLKDSNPLVASNPRDIVRFNHSALVADLCARSVIESYRKAFKEAEVAGLDLSSLSERPAPQTS